MLVYEKIQINKNELKNSLKKKKIWRKTMSCIPTNWHICKHFSDLMWMWAPFLFAD